MTAMLISQLSFFSIKLFLQTFSNLIFSQSFHLLIISKNFLQNFCKSPHNLHVIGCNSSQMCMVSFQIEVEISSHVNFFFERKRDCSGGAGAEDPADPAAITGSEEDRACATPS
jgi:hypothetical protein